MNREPIKFADFAALVEETFDRPCGSVLQGTRCDEVPGWDSLGNSVLLSRLSKRCTLALVEADAVMSTTAGALYERLVALVGAAP